jgi:hypothetical protein
MDRDDWWLVTYETGVETAPRRRTEILNKERPAEFFSAAYKRFPRLQPRIIFAMPLTAERAFRLAEAMANAPPDDDESQ